MKGGGQRRKKEEERKDGGQVEGERRGERRWGLGREETERGKYEKFATIFMHVSYSFIHHPILSY